MLEAAFAQVQGVRVRLTLIEALNSATVSAVVDLPAASWSNSELDQQDALRLGREKLLETVLGWQRACAAVKGKRGTDLLGAIGAAAPHLGGAHSTLMLLSSGFQQSLQLNLYDTWLKDVGTPLEASQGRDSPPGSRGSPCALAASITEAVGWTTSSAGGWRGSGRLTFRIRVRRLYGMGRTSTAPRFKARA